MVKKNLWSELLTSGKTFGFIANTKRQGGVEERRGPNLDINPCGPNWTVFERNGWGKEEVLLGGCLYLPSDNEIGLDSPPSTKNIHLCDSFRKCLKCLG